MYIRQKTQDANKKNEILVLDTKRSNAINIGMTKLPPPRAIKTAILKMDQSIMKMIMIMMMMKLIMNMFFLVKMKTQSTMVNANIIVMIIRYYGLKQMSHCLNNLPPFNQLQQTITGQQQQSSKGKIIPLNQTKIPQLQRRRRTPPQMIIMKMMKNLM